MKAIGAASSSKGGDEGGVSQEDLEKQNTEIQRLNLLVKQRDNEIGILLNYLNKQKEAGESADVAVEGRPVVYENQNNTSLHGNLIELGILAGARKPNQIPKLTLHE